MKTIRQLREERGWTQLQLAIKLGVTPVTIYNWERGRAEPKVSQFRALSKEFGVSMDDIAVTDRVQSSTQLAGSPAPASGGPDYHGG